MISWSDFLGPFRHQVSERAQFTTFAASSMFADSNPMFVAKKNMFLLQPAFCPLKPPYFSQLSHVKPKNAW